MKNKYKSDFLESLHETAVGLNNIGVINDKEMREYDRDCLVPIIWILSRRLHTKNTKEQRSQRGISGCCFKANL
ncbi:hypothetical protein R84B8_02173 [Treponema sp. R8-4-B8]